MVTASMDQPEAGPSVDFVSTDDILKSCHEESTDDSLGSCREKSTDDSLGSCREKSTDDSLGSCRENRRHPIQTPDSTTIIAASGLFEPYPAAPSTSSGNEERIRGEDEEQKRKVENQRNYTETAKISSRFPTTRRAALSSADHDNFVVDTRSRGFYPSSVSCKLRSKRSGGNRRKLNTEEQLVTNQFSGSMNDFVEMEIEKSIFDSQIDDGQPLLSSSGFSNRAELRDRLTNPFARCSSTDFRKSENEYFQRSKNCVSQNSVIRNSRIGKTVNRMGELFDFSGPIKSSSHLQRGRSNFVSHHNRLLATTAVAKRRTAAANFRPSTTVIILYLLLILPTIFLSPVSAQLINPYRMQSVILDGKGKNKCRTAGPYRTETRSSGFIYSHDPYPGPYPGNKNCFLTVKVPEGYHVRLTVQEFYVTGQKGDCDKHHAGLHVFDHETWEDLKQGSPGQIKGQYCGHIRNGTVLATSTLNALTLWWYTPEDLPKWHDGRGFKLLWTAFRNNSKDVCVQGREFPCRNKECIPIQLGCDRIPHCTDSSDLVYKRQSEMKCDLSDLPGFLGLSEVAVGAICGAVVLGSVFIIVLLLICCRDNCKKRPHYEGTAPHRRGPEELTGPLVSKRAVQASDYCNRTHSSSSPNNTAYLNGSTSASMPYCINPRGKPQQGPSPNYLDNSHERMRFDV